MADPLSLLLGKKKEELAAAPKATPAPQPKSLAAAPADPFDLAASLGRAESRVETAPVVAAPRRPEAQLATPSLGASAGYPSSPSSLFGPPAASPAPAPAAVPSASPLGSAGGSTSGPRSPQASVGGAGGAAPAGGSTPTFEDILLGEKVSVVVKGAFLLVANPFCEVSGRVLVTNYRVKFQTPKGTLREELRWMQDIKFFDVPIGLVEDVKEEKSTTNAGVPEYKLRVITKDFRVLAFLMPSEDDSRQFSQALAAFTAPDPQRIFALRHGEASQMSGSGLEEDADGCHLFDPVQDYARMGVETDLIPNPSCPWKLSSINEDYSLCSSYPARLVLPRKMTEPDLRAVANFRKRGRLPAMSWCGGPELQYASLWRCAQTTEGLKGLMGQTCIEDQRLVEYIRRGSDVSHGRDLLVMDLRPWKSAWANKAGGGGFEGYPRCNLVFGGIDNIHYVRDAWRGMGNAVNNVKDDQPGSWMKDVANSNWYDYMGAILNSTMRVVNEILDHKSNVMIHCSDGWDRTAQVASLAMLCLDHQYRTQAGFLQLIQKEWCSFGHRFKTRLALGEQCTSEYSPVFIQWLECVYQLCNQFPTEFEFTTAVLLRLAHDVFTNRYGTFLTDNERERTHLTASRTTSLWSALLDPTDLATWRNAGYKPSRAPLRPSVCQVNYAVWEKYWFRYHPRGQKSREREAAAIAAYGGSVAPSTSAASVLAASTAVAEEAPAPAAASATPPAEVDPHASPLSQAVAPAQAASEAAPTDASEPPMSGAPAPAMEAPPTEAARRAPPSLSALGVVESEGAPAEQKKKPVVKSLFGDDDDEDVFAKHTPKPAAAPSDQAAKPAAADIVLEADFQVVGDSTPTAQAAADEELL